MKNPTPAAEILCGLRAAWGLYIVLNFRTTEPGKEGSRGKTEGGAMLHGQMQNGNAPPGVVLPCLRSNGGYSSVITKYGGNAPA